MAPCQQTSFDLQTLDLRSNKRPPPFLLPTQGTSARFNERPTDRARPTSLAEAAVRHMMVVASQSSTLCAAGLCDNNGPIAGETSQKPSCQASRPLIPSHPIVRPVYPLQTMLDAPVVNRSPGSFCSSLLPSQHCECAKAARSRAGAPECQRLTD